MRRSSIAYSAELHQSYHPLIASHGFIGSLLNRLLPSVSQALTTLNAKSKLAVAELSLVITTDLEALKAAILTETQKRLFVEAKLATSNVQLKLLVRALRAEQLSPETIEIVKQLQEKS